MKTSLLDEMSRLTTARFVREEGEAPPEHKPAAAGAEHTGGGKEGQKMVFGVWRPVGRKLTSAEHQKVGSEYHKASQGHLKAAKEAAAAGDHEKAEHHFGEHVKTASAAKVHYKGWKGQAHDDFYAHPSHRPKGADGQPQTAPHADPFASKPKTPSPHVQGASVQHDIATVHKGGGGGSTKPDGHVDPDIAPIIKGKAPPKTSWGDAEYAKHHAGYVKTYGDKKHNWTGMAANDHQHVPSIYGVTYAQAHAHAQKHNGLSPDKPFHGNIVPFQGNAP